MAEEGPILEGPRLALRTVGDDEPLARGVAAVEDRPPLDPGGEAGSAPPPQPRRHQLVHHRVGAVLVEPGEGGQARLVHVGVEGVDRVSVEQHQVSSVGLVSSSGCVPQAHRGRSGPGGADRAAHNHRHGPWVWDSPLLWRELRSVDR